MTHAEIRAFIDRFVDAWTRQDIDALLECYAPDATISSPMFLKVHGQDKIEEALQDIFRAFGDVMFVVDDVVIDADTQGNACAVLVATSTATHRGEIFGLAGSGRRVETQMMFLFRLSNGRITAERRLYDFTGLLVQLGVLRTKHV